jgi:hypothetical protein
VEIWVRHPYLPFMFLDQLVHSLHAHMCLLTHTHRGKHTNYKCCACLGLLNLLLKNTFSCVLVIISIFVFACSYPYLAVVLNFSQTWALYCLVQFYTVIKDKLQPIKPLAKFLTFKSIVFLTWWQGVAVAFLFSMGAFKGSLAQELKTRIQDYIICIEVCNGNMHYDYFLFPLCLMLLIKRFLYK